jgi:hypothetical protein
VLVLGPCDPPHSPISRDPQRFDTMCVDVRRSDLGPRLEDVLGPSELASARRIVGVDPSEAFAVRHEDLTISAHARTTGTGSSSIGSISRRGVSMS